MAYIIAEPCVGTLDKSCVEVCPVDCIYEIEGADQLFIHPEECIDCGACVDPCPVDAIYQEDELPEKWKDFVEKNRIAFPDLRNPPEDTRIASNPPYEK
jgi:ferredoxin